MIVGEKVFGILFVVLLISYSVFLLVEAISDKIQSHRCITKKSDMVNDKEHFVCPACHTEWISSRKRVAVWSKDDHVAIADDCPTCGKTCTIHRGEEWRRLS